MIKVTCAEVSRPGRFWEYGGWLLAITLSIAVGAVGTVSHDDHLSRSQDAERPLAQISRDDEGSPVWSLAFSPDDHRLACATVSGDVWLKDLDGSRQTLIQEGVMGSARSVAFSPDGADLAIAGIAPEVRIWDTEEGREREPLTPGTELKLTQVAFSRAGKHVAAAGHEGAVWLWEWPSRRRLGRMAGLAEGIVALVFSPDGSVLAACDTSGRFKLWNVCAGNEVSSPWAFESKPGDAAIALSPDGSLLARVSYLEGAVRLWSPASGLLREPFPRQSLSVRSLAFSPDGALLAIARTDGRIALWGVEAGRGLGFLQANERGLQSIAFSNDGRRLATGGIDGCLRLWDVAQALAAERRVNALKTSCIEPTFSIIVCASDCLPRRHPSGQDFTRRAAGQLR
jgi:WD40 repeat protein